MDAQMINELMSILEQEARVFDDVLRISKNKTDLITGGKVNELENIVKLEQALVLQMGRLENRREELVSQISDQIKVKPSEITISQIAKLLKNDQTDKLTKLQNRINNLINELKNTNDLNSKLIKNSLEYIDFSINLMAGMGPVNNNYGSTGQIDTAKKRNFFDMKL